MYYRLDIPINLKYIIKDIILNFFLTQNGLVFKLYAKIFFICFICSDIAVSTTINLLKIAFYIFIFCINKYLNFFIDSLVLQQLNYLYVVVLM